MGKRMSFPMPTKLESHGWEAWKTKAWKHFGLLLFAFGVVAAPWLLWACQTNEVDSEYFLGLQGSDSLAKYDKVIIVVKDSSGNILDTAFQGKVSSTSDLSKLPVPHYRSGTMTIEVSGFEGQTLVLQQAFHYDPATQTPSGNVFVRTPQTKLALPDSAFTSLVGEERAYPKPTLSPADLKDTTLLWSVSDTNKVKLLAHSYIALLPGDVDVIVRLASDTTKQDRMTLRILAVAPNETDTLLSVTLKPDTARVMVGLKTKPFHLELDPIDANPILRFESLDPFIAAVSTSGEVLGVSAGITRIRVYATGGESKGNLSDTSWVVVSDPVETDTSTVRDWIDLYVGGEAETLQVVIPSGYGKEDLAWNDLELKFIRQEFPANAPLGQVILQPVSVGSGLLTVRSAKDSSFARRFPVRVRKDPPQLAVKVEPDTVHIGDMATFTITGTQDFGAFTYLAWNPSGEDSWVEIPGGPWKDSPTVFPTVSQAFTQEGEIPLRFRVKDGEGNDTVYDFSLQVMNAPPSFESFSADTTVSINDTAFFKARVQDRDGGLASASWDYDGDGKMDDSVALQQGIAQLSAGHRYTQAGEHRAVLKVTDAFGKSAAHVFVITVSLHPPIADAGKDTSVLIGALIHIRAGGVDPNGLIVQRELSVAAGPLRILSAQDTTFTAPSTAQTLVCVVRVTDEDGLWDEDTVLVSVLLDSNAALSGLKLSAGALDPRFRSDIFNYTADLAFTDTSVTVTPTVPGAAKITVNGVALTSDNPSRPVKPLVGANPDMFKIVVTAANFSQKTYFISLNRAPNSDSRLTQMAVTGLGHPFVFDTTKWNYSDTVARAITTLTVTPVSRDPNATVTVAGNLVARGGASPALNLVVGTNRIPVVVTAQDGETKTTYTLNIDRRAKLVMEHAIGGSPIPYDSVEVALGASTALHPPILTGFHFRAWAIIRGTGTLADPTQPLTETVAQTDDMRLWAQMDTNAYDLTLSSIGPGSTTPSGTRNGVRHFIRTPIQAIPSANHHFVNWSGPASATFGDALSASTWVSLTGNATVQASFAIDRFTLSLAHVNGTIEKTPDAIEVDYGTPMTLIAKPNPGYNFAGWSGDTTAAKDTITLTVKKNRTLTANFTPKVYNLTVQSNLSMYGCTVTPNGTVPVNHGASTAITAVSSCSVNFGTPIVFYFKQWTVPTGTATVANPSSPTTSVQLNNGDAILIAEFGI